MKGIWIWPSESKEQDEVLRRILREDELAIILLALANHPEGLSNAELDKLLANNSQWRTLPHMRELVGLGFVEYQVQYFGDSGKYKLTELGKTVVPKLQANS
jgi:predicted transcriptional regulator